MKRKDYEKLLDKLWEADRIHSGWRMEYNDYDEVRQPLSKKEAKIEMDKAKEVLDAYKAELEDILTIDMETFANDILEYINETHDKEYEIKTFELEKGLLWVARPKGKTIIDTRQLVYELEDVYVLGKDDKKVLPLQSFNIGGTIFPTMYSSNRYFGAYHELLGRVVVKYDKFDNFMNQYEYKLVEAYKSKKHNKR